MVTVMDLLAHSVFRDFKLVSGQRGLYRPVFGTGIFEWESQEDLQKTFEKGEFVITTLSQAKNDPAYAEHCVKMLISIGVSAVAIKTVYFKEVSEELKAFSNQHNTPLFLFSDTFFDDIIFTIKSAMTSSVVNDHSLKIKNLLKEKDTSEVIEKIAAEINPFFYKNIICCYISYNSKAKRNKKSVEDFLNTSKGSGIYHKLDPSEVVFSAIQYEQSILIIYSMKSVKPDHTSEIIDFLTGIGIQHKVFQIGISSLKPGLENLGIAVKESLYSNTSCVIDQEPLLLFDQIGLDKLLMPICFDSWTTSYYHNLLDKILAYDKTHSYKLMDTLLEYVKSNGDIQLTAKKTFQHGNTIRYRLEKARKILNIEDNPDSYSQLYVFIRLHLIRKNLEHLL